MATGSTNDQPTHWTVTIQVHEVTPPQPICDANGYAVKRRAAPGGTVTVVTSERQVVEKFATTVRADSEAEVYRKAMLLLQVNAPSTVPED